MHGKEEAIAGPIRTVLGLNLCVAQGIDTDQLGTFTGDIPRPGSMEETLRLKAVMGMERTGLDIGFASEGSYGPHPYIPFVPIGLEKMIFLDRDSGLCCIEQIIDPAPCFRSWTIQSVSEIAALEASFVGYGFPEQALIVRNLPERPRAHVYKGIRDLEELKAGVLAVLSEAHAEAAVVDTDMRAHMNPARMRIIADLATALANRLATPCPACGAPGWGKTGIETGLPCSWCAQPTNSASAEIMSCSLCPHSEKKPLYDNMQFADPGLCQNCNP